MLSVVNECMQMLLCVQQIKHGFTSVHGDLLLGLYGFRCKRCDGTIPEANIADP